MATKFPVLLQAYLLQVMYNYDISLPESFVCVYNVTDQGLTREFKMGRTDEYTYYQ